MKLTYEGLKKLIIELLTEKRVDRINELYEYVDKGYFVHLFELQKKDKEGHTLPTIKNPSYQLKQKILKAKDPGHKFGINPKSNYNTPLGIYGYPLIKQIYDQIIDESLPFALERTYLHIFKPKEGTNIIDLQNFTEEDLNYYTKKLQELYLNESINDLIKMGESQARIKSPGGIFWFVTWILQKGTLDWNKLFRKLGIDGFIDNGQGIIHDAEKTQAVFFTKLIVDHVDTIENPTTKSTRYNVKHKFNFSLSKFDSTNEIAKGKWDYLPKFLSTDDWNIISERFHISLEFMKKFEKYLNLDLIFVSNNNITTDIIDNYLSIWISELIKTSSLYYLKTFAYNLKRLILDGTITSQYVENLIDKHFNAFEEDPELDILSIFKFSENFLEKHLEDFRPEQIILQQNISLKFIQDHIQIFGKLYLIKMMITNLNSSDEVRDWAQNILNKKDF